MRHLTIGFLAVALFTAVGPAVEAQSSLPISLFERYVEPLRQQAGIPGMSAAIVQDGRVVWANGFGYQDVEGLVRAAADTPYPILDLTQTLSSTILLRLCMEQHHLELDDHVVRWDPGFPDDGSTVAQLLSHTSPAGGFAYSPARFASLGGVLEQCASARYAPLVAGQIFDRFGMADSLPGLDLLEPTAPDRRWFATGTLDRYAAVARRQAILYRVDSRGVPTRSDAARPPMSVATGAISTVRDLARFDAALGQGLLLTPETLARVTESSGAPTGLGWFAQRYNGERVVWHFGVLRGSSSALIVRLPNRGLTLILLANSDGLAGPPYNLSDGSVTSNLFANLFLRLFVG